MGADIHGVVQTRWKHGSAWRAAMPVEDDRRYVLFAALADVRNYWDLSPIAEPRGLPADFSHDGWIGDHSFTWLTLTELVEWLGWDQVVWVIDGDPTTLRECCDTFLKWLAYLEAKFDEEYEVRLVIGFDS